MDFKIYTQVERVKPSQSFEREYNLKYLGLIGNVFQTRDIEAAIQKPVLITILAVYIYKALSS